MGTLDLNRGWKLPAEELSVRQCRPLSTRFVRPTVDGAAALRPTAEIHARDTEYALICAAPLGAQGMEPKNAEGASQRIYLSNVSRSFLRLRSTQPAAGAMLNATLTHLQVCVAPMARRRGVAHGLLVR